MKHVLIENAYEAWASAIKFCDAIMQGMGTLYYQKNYVSSLHNAVELFLKQIMLDDGDHKVAGMRRIKDKTDARLCLDYMESTDLNLFFSRMTDAQINSFKSIEFCEIIDRFSKITLGTGEVIEIKLALKRLQELRNNETHFMISCSSFLSETDFVILYNFMISFYRIIRDRKLVPFWGEAWGEDNRLTFDRKQMVSFVYLDALRTSALAQSIVAHLNGTCDIGSPTCTSYDIAFELCNREKQFEAQFDEVWSLIEMFQMYGLIRYEEIVDKLPSEFDSYGQHPNIYYEMSINL